MDVYFGGDRRDTRDRHAAHNECLSLPYLTCRAARLVFSDVTKSLAVITLLVITRVITAKQLV